MEPIARLAPGTVFARDFRVVRPLASGGMGAVYVVEQVSTGRPRALKLMHPSLVADPTSRARFVQEATVGARIRSDHVVEVVAAGIDDATGTPWLCMELLEGEDLAAYVARRGALGPDEARDVFKQLGHALAAAHAAGLVHRDLKPENVFVARPRREDVAFTVKVLDFGIAKLVDESSTASASTAAVGTPLWMAPEQADRGRVGPWTDVWALGLIAFHALTGRYYWRSAQDDRRSLSALLAEVLIDALEPASARARSLGATTTLPDGFDAWFARCVARAPEQRFRDGAEAIAALVPLLARAPASGATALGLAATVAQATPPHAPHAPHGHAQLPYAPHAPHGHAQPPYAPNTPPSPYATPPAPTAPMPHASHAPYAATAAWSPGPTASAQPAAPPRKSRAVLVVLAGLGALAIAATALVVTAALVMRARADRDEAEARTASAAAGEPQQPQRGAPALRPSRACDGAAMRGGEIPGLAGVAEFALGWDHSCARRADGVALCWGRNATGELGDGTQDDHPAPHPVVSPAGPGGWARIAAGRAGTCGLRADGTVWCWGPIVPRGAGRVPTLVPQLAGASDLDVGGDYACARATDGGAWCWGDLPLWMRPPRGDARGAAVRASGLAGVEQVAMGENHACARTREGTVACWGYRRHGELGDGRVSFSSWSEGPVPVVGLSDVAEIAAGAHHTCARTRAGAVHCWGQNDSGQLGDGTTSTRATPAPVAGIAGAVRIFAGSSHTCAVLPGNRLHCWGDNVSCQFGAGPRDRVLVPAELEGMSELTDVTAGYAHACGRTSAGGVRCWGRNAFGELGRPQGS